MSQDSGYISLLADARSGNRAAMGRLAVLVWERLYPFVFRTTLDPDASEDILQDTLLVLVCRIHSLRDDERFWPWMYRIAYSKVQDRWRSRRLQSAYEATLAGSREAGRPHAHHESALDAQVRAETLEQVSAAIEQLTRRQRDVLHLRYREQLPYSEVATRTHTTAERARVQSHRAKKSLQKRLSCCV